MNVFIQEENGEFIGTIENFWFVEGGASEEEVICKLAKSLKEFAIDYNNDLELYKVAPGFDSMYSLIEGVINSNVSSVVDAFEIKLI